MAAGLTRLAGAYGTAFPVPRDAVVRRFNDEEAAAIADELAKGADELKKQIDQERSLAAPVRETGKKAADALAKQAKADPKAWLSMTDIFGDLATNPTYVAAFTNALSTLWQIGTRETLKRYLSNQL